MRKRITKEFKNKMVVRKMSLTIFYGLLFIITTLVFYSNNISFGQNKTKINFNFIDSELNLEDYSYTDEIQIDKNQTITLPNTQNDFYITQYISINKTQVDEITEFINQYINKEETKDSINEENTIINNNISNETIIDNNTNTSSIENTAINNTAVENIIIDNTFTNNTIENNVTIDLANEVIEEQNIENAEEPNEEDLIDIEAEKEKLINRIIGESKILKPEDDFDLNLSNLENNNVYFLIKYDTKEVEEDLYYKKYLSENINNNIISVSGYFPKEAEISVKENELNEDTSNNVVHNSINYETNNNIILNTTIENVINNEIVNNATDKSINNEVNNSIIDNSVNDELDNTNEIDDISKYDIKIIVDNKEYDPKDLDENAIIEVKEINTKEEVKEDNSIKTESIDDYIQEKPPIAFKAIRGPASSTEEDQSLLINDYESDYYYYMGQNYTADISGENQEIYSDEDLAHVTINYFGYAPGETDSLMKGRVSLDERADIIIHERCLPIENNKITIELMDNPFMDKPTGYGFGGWTSPSGTIIPDTRTNAQTLSVNTNGDVTVNVYASWDPATVVYVNGDIGSDNGLHDGLSENEPFGSWGKAFEYLRNHNTNDRETNIIVVTGNLDTSINYTRFVTKNVSRPANVTYNSTNNITSGQTYIMATGTGANSNALTANGTGVSNTVLSTGVEPPDAAQWIITASGNGYTIRNKASNYYLAYDNGLVLRSSSYTWSYNNRRFYGQSTGWFSQTHYIRYNNGWTTTTSQGQALQFNFVTYTATPIPNAEDIISYSKGNIESNLNYTSGNAVPVTITSLYNHTDYREDATIALPSSTNGNWDTYNDFQMDFVTINASGYTLNSDGTTFDEYPMFIGHDHNVRIGRGIENDGNTTFVNLIGGNDNATNSYNNAYKLVVESGKYSSIQGFNQNGPSHSYYGIIYLTLGSDIDRQSNNNSDLSVYYRTTINSGGGINRGQNVRDKAFIINVKSGNFGIDYVTANGLNAEDSAFSGIYIGGYGAQAGTNTRDRSDRYFIMEGGYVANIIGGLKTTSGSGVHTRIYMKGGEANNIVAGAGVSTTYENRFIQVTGGQVNYSVSGGSNGVSANSTQNNGRLNGESIVYIGGTATIGRASTINQRLYGVYGGCVLGAGNGNESYKNLGAGQVNNSHVIINDSAHILNNVYGGGNFGIVGASGSTTATAKIDILGGTIDNNVYGGANQNNIYGSTTINMYDGTVKGGIYGGSNEEGTISTTAIVNIYGGDIGLSTYDETHGVLFGGGYGSSTTITNNATVNIYDTSNDVNIYGSAYGGSSLGRVNGNTEVIIQDIPDEDYDINIVGNVFAGGKGDQNNSALVNGNSTIIVDGANLPNASIFGGNDQNGTTNGAILVKIGENYDSSILNVYGGGNVDSTGLEADSVKVYLYENSDVTNAYNGGMAADLVTNGNNDTTRAIYLEGGNAENIFGGSDTNGTVTASHVYINSGTATNVFGGNNLAGQTTTSFVYIEDGTITNVYGGGLIATTPTTNVLLNGGTITNGFGGGSNANVTTSNITLQGTTATSIYGGSNQGGTVTTSNVNINSGTVTDVYGGNNQNGNTVTTNVNINSPATNVYGGGNRADTTGNTTTLVTSTVNNVYGGGNQAETQGNTYVKLTNATVTNSAFGGGNGSQAIVLGNSTIIVEGTTSITNDLFGGGNAAANGTAENPNSLVTTLITGGTIGKDVYGAANTSVVNGNAVVKIGSNAVNDNTLAKDSISIGGTVFGGGKSNTAGSENYDFTFESVTGDVNITIDATGYDGNNTETFNIDKSIFGSGNAAKISGNGYITVVNYGSSNDIKENISIQRATQVTLDHCYIHLAGTKDRTNEIATAIYTFNRIDDLRLKNNTTLYLDSGVNITAKLRSLDSNGNKEAVTITDNGITNQTVDNRIYLSQGKNIILKTENGNNGEVEGMAFVGLYKGSITNTGIYGTNYTDGNSIPSNIRELFERNSYIQGKHYNDHHTDIDGYYTNYDEDGTIDVRYIVPTPESADYYQWIAGKISEDIYYDDIELIATKYATTATHVLSLDGLSYPNAIVKVMDFDTSELTQSITLNMPTTIPKIAPTAQEADSRFGITMTAGTTGWQSRGTTNFLNNDDVQSDFVGTKEYISDNSTTTPTFSFYMDHSKNISSTDELGYVKIHLEVTYIEDEEIHIKNAYIILKLTTNNTIQGQDYYEGAITPGIQYSIFPTNTTNITSKSTFSAYYSLYIGDYSETNYYFDDVNHNYDGMYYHTISTTCVLPANTKITLIDTTNPQYRYYYYIVSQDDEDHNTKTFRFSDFICMDSTQELYSADYSYYNEDLDLFFEEFIVQVAFEDTELENTLELQRILIELRDGFDDTIALTVNTAQFPMLFSVYNDIPVTANLTLTTNKTVLYMGESLNLGIDAEYSYNRNENLDIVYDTTHIENQLGVRIVISTGSDALTSQDLEGIYIRYNNKNYFARSDGTFRMKIADTVTNVLANMTLYTTNGQLDTGTYIITAQSFGSIDGVYFSTPIVSDSKQVQIVNTNYGFKVEMNNNSILVDKETGLTKNNTNDLTFTIGYSGYFENTEVTVALYRRRYDETLSTNYDLVDLDDYVSNTLITTSDENIYLVSDNLQTSQNYNLLLNQNLMTGTYKIRFCLYDNDILIDTIDKSIIIK